MQVRLPPDTRRSFEWIAGLTAEGALVALGGTLTVMMWWSEPWPLGVRVPLSFLTALVGAALAWGRYPLEEGGDRLTVWVGRAWRFATQHRHVLVNDGRWPHGRPH